VASEIAPFLAMPMGTARRSLLPSTRRPAAFVCCLRSGAPVRLPRIGKVPHRAAPVLGRNRLPGQTLDVPKLLAFIQIAKRDGDPLGPGACRATYAMDIAFRHVREFIIDDVRYQIDVNAARGNVGRNQRPDSRGAKGRERLLALRLALVAMDSGDADAGGDKMIGDTIGPAFGAREHQRARHRFIGEQLHQ
jgi:hypothetical protein